MRKHLKHLGEAEHLKNLINKMQKRILVGNNSKYIYFPQQQDTILGKGKFSIVYLAAEISSRQKVICKQLSPALFDNQTAKLKFFIESGVNLNHNNIVKTLDLVVEDDAIFLIQEFVPGLTLKELINDKKYFDCKYNNYFYKIILECLDAVGFIHSNNLCHCDLKPANIIIENEYYEADLENPKIKIIDFGNIKTCFKSTELDRENRTYNMMYGSPEQIFGFTELIGEHTDIFSLGLILYEAISKEPALNISNPLLLRRLQSVVKIQKHYRFTDDIFDIISKATVKPDLPKPEKYYSNDEIKLEIIKSLTLRYQSTEDFKLDLQKLVS